MLRIDSQKNWPITSPQRPAIEFRICSVATLERVVCVQSWADRRSHAHKPTITAKYAAIVATKMEKIGGSVFWLVQRSRRQTHDYGPLCGNRGYQSYFRIQFSSQTGLPVGCSPDW